METKKQEHTKNCSDWKLVWDEDKIPMAFPPEIVTRSSRPDIIIHSTSMKVGIVVELTVPAEENMAQANLRKKCKYEDLIREGKEAGWALVYFPVEVGSRGFASQSLRTCLKFLGLTKKGNQCCAGCCVKSGTTGYIYFVAVKKQQDFRKLGADHKTIYPSDRRKPGRGPTQPKLS
ncbi:uncharacterized protein LOC121420618 [Lytechinus variegatus]|uniref:uncharacterized protein LOC121420618 n=1 Tax=Lytechinus variegatus TaxID=7654 RepID=UPI001BB1684B|nr:uncharacterized protein LOC121420618 [Lytechinus variegatus]